MENKKLNKKFQEKLEKIADDLIFEQHWDYLESQNLAFPDDELGVAEGIWDLVMDALIRGYYLGKGKEVKQEAMQSEARHSSQA